MQVQPAERLPIGEDRNHQRPWGESYDMDLLSLLALDQEDIAMRQRRVDEVKIELLTRMEERGAETIPSEAYICQRRVANTYDYGILTPIKEKLLPSDLAKCYMEAYDKTIHVEESWNMTQLKPIGKDYGDDVQGFIARARIPGRPTLVFKERLDAPSTGNLAPSGRHG